MYTRLRGNLSLFSFLAALMVAGAGQARAQGSELERLQQCDRDLCSILRTPSAAGRPLQCDLSMTWYKDQIDKAAKAKGLIWPLGDAHCKAKVDIKRAVITRALTENSYHMKVQDQAATCDVDYKGTLYPVKAFVAPELEFRDGKAMSVTLGIHNIEATTMVKALVWSAVKLQEKLGAYQEDMVREINKYIETQCRPRAGKREAEIQTDDSRLVP